ncbi:MAG: YqaJ viral recombinase family protein [Phycisphaerales bacterium]
MLTPAQLEERRNWIGASDVPAILGVDPYRNARDIWAEKVYGLYPEVKDSEAASIGSDLETSVLNWAERKLGTTVHRTDLHRPVEGTHIRVSLDGWVDVDGVHVPTEAKTTGIVNPYTVHPDDWDWRKDVEEWSEAGDSYSDRVPFRVAAQIQSQMLATKAPFGYCPAFIGGRGRIMFKVEHSQDLADLILEVTAEFWSCVVERREPEGEAPSMDTLKRIVRPEGKIVRWPHSAMQQVLDWRRDRANRLEAEKVEEQSKAVVIAMLKDAEFAHIAPHAKDVERLAAIENLTPEKAAAKQKLKYARQTRSGIDTEKLKRDFPDVYKVVKTETSYPVLDLVSAPNAFIEAAAEAELVDAHQLALEGGT